MRVKFFASNIYIPVRVAMYIQNMSSLPLLSALVQLENSDPNFY